MGLGAPTVVAVPVDGGANQPSPDDGSDAEVALDIQVAGGVAPGARIAVYFAPNTDAGFVDAVSMAAHDSTNRPSVMSISWGSAESNWTAQALQTMTSALQDAAGLDVSVFVAAGDNLATDGVSDGKVHVDFPASSPHVLACGGTKLDANGATIVSEVVWNELANNEGATGGGVSNVFALPPWQDNSNVPKPGGTAGGRGVPDVTGDADPATGYTIRVDGKTMVIGGTSAVAPLWAGLVAVANAQLGTQVGVIQPAIYAAKAASAFNDITVGNNPAFSAGPGWDACSGLGSPIAAKLIPLLAPAATSSTASSPKAAKAVNKPVKKAAKRAPEKKTAGKRAK